MTEPEGLKGITLTEYGAAMQVPGSMLELHANGKSYLIDCGVDHGADYGGQVPKSLLKSGLEAVILTHAHLDHVGKLLELYAKGYDGEIHTTPTTAKLTSYQLADSLRYQSIAQDKGKNGKNKHNQIISTDLLIDQLIVRYANGENGGSGHALGETIHLSPNIDLTLYDAGHIPGSCQPLIECRNGRGSYRMLVCCDLGRLESETLQGDIEAMPYMKIPHQQFDKDIDCFVLEATYGSREHQPISDSLECLKESIRDAYKSGGRLIIPAFSIMRSQMMLYYLFKMYQKEMVPKLPIYYVSPSAMDVNSTMYLVRNDFNEATLEDFSDPENNPFIFEQLHYMRDKSDNDALFTKQGAFILIGSSGMCDMGRVLGHLRYSVENPKNLIFLPGWQNPDSLGGQFMLKAGNPNAAPTLTIMGEKVKVAAGVQYADFSNHTDNIWEHVAQIMPPDRPPKKIFIKHGEEEGCQGVRDRLYEMGYPPEIIQIMAKGVSYPL